MSQNHTRRVVIAGGGTGGHLFPGVAVAEEIVRLDPSVTITFVGTTQGIEARVVPKLGYELRTIGVEGIFGRSGWNRLRGVLRLPGAGVEAIGLVRELDPSLVISVGGYAAGPITMCAAAMRRPTALLEQNSVPGRTNRLLGRVVDRAFLTYASSRAAFSSTECEITGNPLRRQIVEAALDFQYEPPKVGEPMRVLVLGGSGGSLAMNEGVPREFAQLSPQAAERVEVLHQVGRQRADVAHDIYAQKPLEGRAHVVEFIEDMAEAYEQAHVIVCRAGATTIAEVLAFGIPAIYVPFPGAADDHQTHNAREIDEAGAGKLLPDSALGSGDLSRLIEQWSADPEMLAEMATRARELGRPQAGEVIAKRCLELMT